MLWNWDTCNIPMSRTATFGKGSHPLYFGPCITFIHPCQGFTVSYITLPNSLNSWIHVSMLTSICERRTSSGHLRLTAATAVICLPGVRPCDLQPAECEPAANLCREFQTAFPTGRKCSYLLQTGMIRVARQHIPNCHAAKIPHFNARSCLENTPRTERLCLLS